jgi:cytochrome c-type biogenesis protein CcsB
MEAVFLVVATLCYCAGSIGYFIYLLRDREIIHRVSWAILLVGAAFHGGAILLRSSSVGYLAVTSNQEALSFFAWVFVVTYLLVQLRLQLRILGSFVSPLAVVFMLLSQLLPTHIIPNSGVFQSGWVIFHVTTLFLANALFALAFSAGIMYLLQERHIKRKNFGHLYSRLPSLDRLDRLNYICLIIGFPLMTAGLVTGFAYASSIWPSPWKWDPKEIFALITWFIYAILLHERLAVGWRGRKAAWLAIFGFSAVLMTFLGVNLILKGHHTVFIR